MSRQETFIGGMISGNRVTIPNKIVEVLNLKIGDTLRITIEKVEDF